MVTYTVLLQSRYGESGVVERENQGFEGRSRVLGLAAEESVTLAETFFEQISSTV